MTTKYFNFSDVLGFGWRTMKVNFALFLGVGIVWLGLSYIPTIIDVIARRLFGPEAAYWVIHIFTTIFGWIISILLGIGMIKIALGFCDERKPAFSTLFDVSWNCFWRYLGAAILYGLIMLGGFILFIVPGVIWSVKYSLCFYFIVDKGFGPVEAIKASGRTTMGVKWELFGFGILCGLINLLGLLCLFVGIFATYPTTLVANALVYRQLVAQTPELDEFGIPVPIVNPILQQPQNPQQF
jgi:uncharacterized membrane protein